MRLKELDVLLLQLTLRENTEAKFVESFYRQQMEGLQMFCVGNLVGLIRRRSRQERLYLTNKPLKLIRLHTCYLPTVTNNR